MRYTDLILIASLFCATAANAQNLIVNGSFEEPVLRSGSSAPETVRLTRIPGWTIKDVNGNEVDGEIQRNLSPVSNQEGKQWVELDANVNTTIYQDIQTVPGQRYAFRYRDAQRGGSSSDIQVLVDDKEIGFSTPTSASFRGIASEFIASAAVTRIGLRGRGQSDSVGDLVDDVRVYAIDAQGARDGYNYYFPFAAEGQGWRTSVVMTPTSSDGFSYTLTEYGSQGETLRRSSGSTAANGLSIFVTPTANTGQFLTGWFHIKTIAPANILEYFRLQIAGASDAESAIPPRVPARSFTGVFDNRNGLNSALAVANPGSSAITLKIVLRNSFGETIREDSLGLPAKGNLGFVLKDRFSQTANIHGLIEIQATDTVTAAEANFVAAGLRVSATGASPSSPTDPILFA